ncbi:hypothetical protein ACE3MS_31305 [Paenibacillus dendritiformis]|uniref:hypothetical protein n=1 Tax=Paenibacillus dendritiformis TaxID=130049 RepID=UPI003666F1F0
MKRVMALLLAAIVIFGSATASPARANPIVVAAGSIEIGALAFWGGAVLVAAAGTAVGLDKDLMNDVEEWGRSVWEGASDSIREGISSAVSSIEWGSSKRYEVEWSPEVRAYLSEKWLETFKYAVVTNGIVKSVPGAGTADLPSDFGLTTEEIRAGYNIGVAKIQTGVIGGKPQYTTAPIQKIQCQSNGNCSAIAGMSGYTIGVYPNALEAYYDAVVKFEIVSNDKTKIGSYVKTGVYYPPLAYPAPDVFPERVTIPAPTGTLNPDGTVRDYAPPTIGRVGGTITGDIAIGWPDVVGDVGALNPADSVKAPAIPQPGTGTGTLEKDVSGIRTNTDTMARDMSGVRTDVGEISRAFRETNTSERINWEPLKLAGSVFTNKFPFSIPWDIKRQLDVFNVAPQAPVFSIDKPDFLKIAGHTYPLKMKIDLSSFDVVAAITRWFLIIAFDLGVILSMRRFMPE